MQAQLISWNSLEQSPPPSTGDLLLCDHLTFIRLINKTSENSDDICLQDNNTTRTRNPTTTLTKLTRGCGTTILTEFNPSTHRTTTCSNKWFINNSRLSVETSVVGNQIKKNKKKTIEVDIIAVIIPAVGRQPKCNLQQ